MVADPGDAERELEALRARVRELEVTERRLRDVFHELELVVVALDLDANITYLNPFGERLSGWSDEEVRGTNWFDQFRSGRGSFISRVQNGEFPTHDQSTIIVRNGDRRQVDWYNVPLRDETGAVIGILGIGRDMTAERTAQRSLEVAERRMLDVLETVDLIAGQVDLDGRLTYVNEFLIRLLGQTRDELLGRHYVDAFGSGNQQFMDGVRTGDFPPHDRGVIISPSAGPRDIEWTNVGLYDNHGELTGVVGIGRDVTDQLRAEGEARELVAEHEALERVATAVARGLDSDVVFRMVAEEAGRLVGADGCTLLRFEPGEQAMIVANWGDVEAAEVRPQGALVPIDAGPAMAATLTSGRPERSDERGMGGPIQEAVAAPIVVTGNIWGTLVAWRLGEHRLAADTERRLGAFGSLAGTAVSNADARTALAASRKRIVAAGDEARRRLERNLHDGAQQRFVSLSLALRMTLAQLRRDPDAAELQLRAALDELSMGLEELRELARGIHPAILTERGLDAALESLAARTPMPVTVELDLSCRLSPDVEAAAYYVVAEALTNVTRYAEARHAAVHVRNEEGVVLVEVTDDGRGGAMPSDGSGLHGLADRVDAVGGRLEVTSPPGAGTRVVARLPLVERTA
jgi:PAS domain S-box-containing protein